MLKTVLFFKFRVSEYIQFFTDVRQLCAQNSQAVEAVQQLLNAFIASIQMLEDTFKANQASELTAELQRLDARRDQAIICLRKFADAYTSHHDPALQEAGHKLLNCIDKYGSRIYAMNYQAETSTLTNLGNELTHTGEMHAVISLLDVPELVAEMILQNDAFGSLFVERVIDNTAQISVSSGEAIKQTMAEYRTLTEHLQAHTVIAPTESNTKLIAEMNTLIDHYNTMVEHRSNHNDDMEAPDASDEAA